MYWDWNYGPKETIDKGKQFAEIKIKWKGGTVDTSEILSKKELIKTLTDTSQINNYDNVLIIWHWDWRNGGVLSIAPDEKLTTKEVNAIDSVEWWIKPKIYMATCWVWGPPNEHDTSFAQALANKLNTSVRAADTWVGFGKVNDVEKFVPVIKEWKKVSYGKFITFSPKQPSK